MAEDPIRKELDALKADIAKLREDIARPVPRRAGKTWRPSWTSCSGAAGRPWKGPRRR